MKNSDIAEVKQPFVDAYETGTKLQIPSVQDTIILKEELLWTRIFGDVYITVTDPNNNVTTVATGETQAAEFTLSQSGPYMIRYYGQTKRQYQNSSFIYTDFGYRYYINAVENHYPLKPPTIKQVIERNLLLAEPLTVVVKNGKAEFVRKPRFRFGYKYPLYEYPRTAKQTRAVGADGNTYKQWDEDGNPIMEGEPLKDSSGNPIPNAAGKSERKLFEKTAPEFTFTRCTLREMLQEVGKFLHAEPRLAGEDVVIYDRYGEEVTATFIRNSDSTVQPMTNHPYKSKRYSQNANTALTRIESTVDNFVNRLDGLGGTVTQPYRNGAISLRTDTAYIRTEDAVAIVCELIADPSLATVVMCLIKVVVTLVSGIIGVHSGYTLASEKEVAEMSPKRTSRCVL